VERREREREKTVYFCRVGRMRDNTNEGGFRLLSTKLAPKNKQISNKNKKEANNYL